MIRKKVKHIYFKSFIDNADIINTHNYFTSYSEFFNIKETALLVILDSVELEKTMSYHDLFLLWSKAFENVGIPIYIVFPDDVMKLKKFYRFYNTDIHYISDVDLIERLDCVQEKVVFGKKYRVILPKMYVVHDKKLVNEQKRINNKMIKKLYIRALELKFENFIKKIKNSVDIPNNLW